MKPFASRFAAVISDVGSAFEPRRRWSRMALGLVAMVALNLVWQAPAHAADHSIGLGAHFFKTVDDLAGDGFDDIEEDGYAYVVSWKIEPEGIFFFEIDAEYYPDGFAGSTDGTVVPTAFLGVGHGWYAAIGVGVAYSGGLSDDVSDPIWNGRIGFDWSILPGLSLDLNANYRANAYDELDQASTDAVTIGAQIRISF